MCCAPYGGCAAVVSLLTGSLGGLQNKHTAGKEKKGHLANRTGLAEGFKCCTLCRLAAVFDCPTAAASSLSPLSLNWAAGKQKAAKCLYVSFFLLQRNKNDLEQLESGNT